MKNQYLSIFCLSFAFTACDDQIFPQLDDAPPVLVVDAWIDDRLQDQVIHISMTQPYFDNAENTGVEGAEVYILDDNNVRFDFTDSGEGSYTWTPGVVGFGEVGTGYFLFVNVDGLSFISESKKNRVPKIDSINFTWEAAHLGFPENYQGAFWSRDILGVGDTYWIKSYKNEQYLSKPSEINIAYDAGFSAGGSIDNFIFIPPIRDAVNPFDQDEDDVFISPYTDGDSLYVEIYSITEEAFYFLQEVRIQTNRPGGFGELFATPLSNVHTNILNMDENSEVFALGYFSVSSVEGNGRRLDISEVPKG